ncbi:hypothetical protein PMAYCL1PPCAC_33297 [Pristionchus mayeri]|uniref:Uncharacterized protein n=1 Tax=Pristionchus mayeri TaxID=1317129 RepID=A0AAN5IE72_9BILA|nr:hypothetical protein PMAYCL1PPCAC_33297 [Pristionchus mayeri]
MTDNVMTMQVCGFLPEYTYTSCPLGNPLHVYSLHFCETRTMNEHYLLCTIQLPHSNLTANQLCSWTRRSLHSLCINSKATRESRELEFPPYVQGAALFGYVKSSNHRPFKVQTAGITL